MTYHRLGKFDSALDELIFDLATWNEWATESEGHTEDFGVYRWVMTIEGPLNHDELVLVAGLAAQIDADDNELTTQIFGRWIVSEYSGGSVTVSKYETEAHHDAAWAECQQAYEAWADKQEEDA
jgi:hypothetical protein